MKNKKLSLNICVYEVSEEFRRDSNSHGKRAIRVRAIEVRLYILTSYHTCPKIRKSPFITLLMYPITARWVENYVDPDQKPRSRRRILVYTINVFAQAY